MRGDQQARESLRDVLKITVAGIVGANGKRVAALSQMRAKVDLIVGPVSLKSTGRSAADEAAIKKKLVGLVGGNEERRPRGKLAEIERLSKKRVAIVNVPVGRVGPDPTGFGEGG